MSRGRLYVLIDGFEQDLRSIIDRYLLDHMSIEEVFVSAELAEASGRREADGTADGVGLVQYLDLQTAVDVLLRHKSKLPHELTIELTTQAPHFPLLVPIRHRVMHGRPLKDSDPSVAVQLLAETRSRHWVNTKRTIKRLSDDPTWEPYFEKLPLANERTLHNLPEVDYDETSFIGRKKEQSQLLDLLKRRRNSVITLTGEGGIGKTALALDAAYQLLDSDENPYEAILWVSLKTEKLTAYGVEELKDAIRGIDHTIIALGQGLTSDFNGSLRDLASALEGIETLIIIDNLESAQGNEIVEMYDVLPSSVNYLFTSRWGIGQLERTLPVPPLAENDAVLLLRKFAVARRQSVLASLSPTAAAKSVGELRNSPLAIRWFVLASEAGRVPLETLRNQEVLLGFCVKNVVDNLSSDSRAVLSVLGALDRSIGFDEFGILTEMSIDTLRKVTQELTRGSLVVVEAETAGAIAGRLALSATARSFLPRPDLASDFMATVRRRERQYKASLETSLEQGGSAVNLSRIKPRDSNDHPALYLLQTAQSFAHSGNFTQAHANVSRAKSFNPEFSEVYRVSGLVLSKEGRHEAAVAELQTALSFASDDDARARARYAIADIVSRFLRDSNQALPHAETAYNLVKCCDSAFLYGKLLVWTGQFKEGQEYLQDALDEATGRSRLMVTTTVVDSWGRWADAEYKAYEYDSAMQKASGGFHIGRQLLDGNPKDHKLLDALSECGIVALRSAPRVSESLLQRQSGALRSVGQFVKKNAKVISPKKSVYLRDALGIVRNMSNVGGETQALLQEAHSALAIAR